MKYIFISIILAKCLYLAVPQIMISPFLMPGEDMKEVTLYTYLWATVDIGSIFLVTLICWLMVSGVVKITAERIKAVQAYVLVAGFDLCDFLITGNSEWFDIGSYPVTNNIFLLPVYWLLVEFLPSGKHDI